MRSSVWIEVENAHDIHANLEHLTNTLQKGETHGNILHLDDFPSCADVNPPQSTSAVLPEATHSQPVNFGDLPAEAPILNIPSSTTPRYGQLLDNLANHTPDVADQYPADFLDNLTSKLMWGAVLQEKIPKGLSPDAALDAAQRLEYVLVVVGRFRHSLHPASHFHPANAAQAGPDKVFNDDDMKMALKTWENNPKD